MSAIAIALPRWAIASWKAERRSAWSPALAPPFDREIVETGLGEMMGDRLGLRVRAEQCLGAAAMQRLAPALQETLVSRVADQRVLETIGRIWRRAVDEEKTGFGEAFEGGL